MTRVRRRPRTRLVVLVLLGCWVLGLPGSVTVLAVGLLLLVFFIHRLGRPVYVVERFGRPVYLVQRRTWIRPLAIAAVVGLLLFAGAPPAGADPIGRACHDFCVRTCCFLTDFSVSHHDASWEVGDENVEGFLPAQGSRPGLAASGT